MSEPPDPSPRRNLSLIVAMSENNVIGRDGGMPWHISADLRRFKKLTMGHTIIMGRKTFESIGRCLPGRITIVISRNTGFSLPPSNEVFHVTTSLNSAIELANNDSEAFAVGGGQIYEAALPFVSKIYLTRVHARIGDGDTFFPRVDWKSWNRTRSEHHSANEKNDHDFSFEDYQRPGELAPDSPPEA